MCLRRLEKLMLPYTSIACTHKSIGRLPLSQNINIKANLVEHKNLNINRIKIKSETKLNLKM
jgi:hypothetical protein